MLGCRAILRLKRNLYVIDLTFGLGYQNNLELVG